MQGLAQSLNLVHTIVNSRPQPHSQHYAPAPEEEDDFWGPVYAVLLLARAMGAYFVHKAVVLLSPLGLALPPFVEPPHGILPPEGYLSLLGSPESRVQIPREVITAGLMDMMKKNKKMNLPNEWNLRNCVDWFRWCCHSHEAISLCSDLASQLDAERVASQPVNLSDSLGLQMQANFIPNPNRSQVLRSVPSRPSITGLSPSFTGGENFVDDKDVSVQDTLPRYPCSLREACELSSAIAIVDSRRLTQEQFWSVISQHVDLAVKHWDLSAVLSLFNACPSMHSGLQPFAHIGIAPGSVKEGSMGVVSMDPAVAASTLFLPGSRTLETASELRTEKGSGKECVNTAFTFVEDTSIINEDKGGVGQNYGNTDGQNIDSTRPVRDDYSGPELPLDSFFSAFRKRFANHIINKWTDDILETLKTLALLPPSPSANEIKQSKLPRLSKDHSPACPLPPPKSLTPLSPFSP